MATGDSNHPGPGATDPHVTVEELTDNDTGRWQITTGTTIHLLDLDNRQVTRIPGAAAEHSIDKGARIIHAVRTSTGDHQPQKLDRRTRCRRAEPMYSHLAVDADCVAPVVSTSTRDPHAGPRG